MIMDENIRERLRGSRNYHAAGGRYSVEQRRMLLRRLLAELQVNRERIMAALHADLHKSEFEASVTEFIPLLEALRFMIRKLPRLAKTRRAAVSPMNFPARGRLVPEPYGVVLVCATWNYPLLLALEPVIGAVAAGNSVVLKLSDKSQATMALVAELLEKASDSGQVATVGDELSFEEILKERFDYIFYTGSEYGGRKVLAAAAPHLTPVTLELGGKSPCIVCADADLAVAAKRIVWGKFTNAGQTCVAPDYLLVHRSVKSRLLDEMRKRVREFYGENPLENPDYAHIVNRLHYDRLCKLLGDRPAERDPERLCIAPVIVEGVTPDDPLMAGEIFGPILPVLEFSENEEALGLVRKLPKPLALYCFGGDREMRRRVTEEISSGAVSFNDVVMHFVNPAMPFGGVGNSGMGRYHGKYSFETFTHYKPVMAQSGRIDWPVRYPPFREWQKKLARLLSR
jgi:probable aldehyde dehydrogenase ywdH